MLRDAFQKAIMDPDTVALRFDIHRRHTSRISSMDILSSTGEMDSFSEDESGTDMSLAEFDFRLNSPPETSSRLVLVEPGLDFGEPQTMTLVNPDHVYAVVCRGIQNNFQYDLQIAAAGGHLLTPRANRHSLGALNAALQGKNGFTSDSTLPYEGFDFLMLVRPETVRSLVTFFTPNSSDCGKTLGLSFDGFAPMRFSGGPERITAEFKSPAEFKTVATYLGEICGLSGVIVEDDASFSAGGAFFIRPEDIHDIEPAMNNPDKERRFMTVYMKPPLSRETYYLPITPRTLAWATSVGHLAPEA